MNPGALFNPRRGITVLVAACAVTLAASCKPEHRENVSAAETAPAAAPAIKMSPYEPTNQLPPDLFSKLPVFPGASVEHVGRPKGVMREIWFNGGEKSKFSEMASFFKDELPKDGFTVSNQIVLAGRKTFSCQFTNNGRQGSLEIYPSDADKSRLTIDLTYEMPAKVDPSLVEPKEVFDVIGPGAVAQNAPNSSEEIKRN